MRILGRYVFREILLSSFLATTLATFIIFLRYVPRLLELLLRSGDGKVFLQLCIYSLPPVVLLSIPFGVLVGILIGLGRMSADNELIAMRSGGVSSRVVVPPVVVFSLIAMLVAGVCAVWLNPLAIRAELKLENKVGSSMTADIVPQVLPGTVHKRQYGPLRRRQTVGNRPAGAQENLHRRYHAAQRA